MPHAAILLFNFHKSPQLHCTALELVVIIKFTARYHLFINTNWPLQKTHIFTLSIWLEHFAQELTLTTTSLYTNDRQSQSPSSEDPHVRVRECHKNWHGRDTNSNWLELNFGCSSVDLRQSLKHYCATIIIIPFNFCLSYWVFNSGCRLTPPPHPLQLVVVVFSDVFATLEYTSHHWVGTRANVECETEEYNYTSGDADTVSLWWVWLAVHGHLLLFRSFTKCNGPIQLHLIPATILLSICNTRRPGQIVLVKWPPPHCRLIAVITPTIIVVARKCYYSGSSLYTVWLQNKP